MQKEKLSKEHKKELALLAAAIVLPFGLTALGLWKAYELYKGKTKEKDETV